MHGKLKRLLCIPHKLLLLFLVFPVVVAVRLIKPWFLVRWGVLPSPRIGHFAANTELYLCERDAGINLPCQPHVDIFFMEPKICNEQLAKMWKRVLRICPAWWLVPQMQRANRLIPGGAAHEIGDNTQSDRDVHNLFDRFPPHLQFTSDEEERGEAGLRAIGVPVGAQFVCLIVRDSAYLDVHQPKDWSYHNYRDSDVQNYLVAAESLVKRGYYVIRMGSKVHDHFSGNSPKVIDYATNGMRTDFMDIYLGARCSFCISNSTGFDAIPTIFRRPVVYVNVVPVGYLQSYRKNTMAIFKHHWDETLHRNLTLKEIMTQGLGHKLSTMYFKEKGVELVENTPKEIDEVVLEFEDMLNDRWNPSAIDKMMQIKFQDVYFKLVRCRKVRSDLHGDVRILCGSNFLKENPEFLN